MNLRLTTAEECELLMFVHKNVFISYEAVFSMWQKNDILCFLVDDRIAALSKVKGPSFLPMDADVFPRSALWPIKRIRYELSLIDEYYADSPEALYNDLTEIEYLFLSSPISKRFHAPNNIGIYLDFFHFIDLPNRPYFSNKMKELLSIETGYATLALCLKYQICIPDKAAQLILKTAVSCSNSLTYHRNYMPYLLLDCLRNMKSNKK